MRIRHQVVLFSMQIGVILLLSSPLQADFDSAADAYRAKDYLRALETFQPLAEQGDPRAQTVLALMHKYGEGTPLDLGLSFNWYKKAAELGYAPAQYHTGVMLAEGMGTGTDLDEAVSWLTKSAASGFQRANDKLQDLHASRVTIDSPVDEFIPWSQSWDFKLPEMRFTQDNESTFSAVTSIPNYRVQLGAMSSMASAEQLWYLLTSNNPTLFEGLSLLVKEYIRPDRTYYRVQTGPFNSLGQARSFCTNLTNSSSRGIGCLALQPVP